MTMNILAVDPGIANTGWACSDGRHGTIVTKATLPLYQRIAEIAQELYLQCSSVDLVIVEDTFGNFVKPTTMLVGGLMGVFGESEFVKQFLLVGPGRWVRELFGREHQGDYKAQALKLAQKSKTPPGSQHAADAICLLEWYKIHYAESQKTKVRRVRKRPAKAKRSNPRRARHRPVNGRL